MSNGNAPNALGRVRIGISGWHYPEWRGGFYPKNLKQAEELPFASARFPTIELNSTFYGLQSPGRYALWAERTPPGFVFAVKGPREILRCASTPEVRSALANFFASGVLRLGDKLGPFLWQFPASFQFDATAFSAFLSELPHDTAAAVELAHWHDAVRMAGRTWFADSSPRPLYHAVEVRHPSFATPTFMEMLRERGIALVCSDSPKWPRLMDVTAAFIYCRLHGAERLYISGYDDAALASWAARIAAWAEGDEPADTQQVAGAKTEARDVYVYFDNTMHGRAPFDALRLQALLHPHLGA